MSRVRLALEWKEVGSMGIGSCPMLPKWQTRIGRSKDGVLWACECVYDYHRQMFRVDFANEEMVDAGDTFWFCCPDSILEADDFDYWKLRTEYFHTVYCRYEQIQDVIRAFCIDHHLDTKRVDGTKVVAS